MGNRKKSRQERLQTRRRHRLEEGLKNSVLVNPSGQAKLNIPTGEKEVEKIVPATIKYFDLPDHPRDDEETIGKTVIYKDGTLDLIVLDDISDDAKEIVYSLQNMMMNIVTEDAHGTTE